LKTDDLTFRPVYLANAPDGSLVIADFREEYIAHGQNYQSQIDPSTGRIYRLRGKDLPIERDVNLSIKKTAQLVALLAHANQWHRQTAVRMLAERRDALAVPLLKAQLEKPDTHPALEALWALYQMGRLDERLAPDVETTLYRIAQEALNNAVRHADANEIGFRVRVLEDRLEISISDNGSGFDPSGRSNGHGLSNLRTRLKNLNGRCELESAPGAGTTVSLQLPLPVRNHLSSAIGKTMARNRADAVRIADEYGWL